MKNAVQWAMVALTIFAAVCIYPRLGKEHTLHSPVALEIKAFIGYQEEGKAEYQQFSKHTYTRRETVLAGERFEFYVASDNCDYKIGCEPIKRFGGVAPQEPGIYWAIGRDEGTYTYPVFVLSHEVNAPRPCLLISTYTSQAYNPFGGKSFYSSPYTEPIQVSLNRPLFYEYDDDSHGHFFPTYVLYKRLGIDLHVFDDSFLDSNSNFLQDNCSALTFSRHPEYWSRSMYDDIKAFIASGGDVLNLAGNIAYWFTELGDRTITVDKIKENRDVNRISRFDESVKELFGLYYVGYPISRKLPSQSYFEKKYPNIFSMYNNSYEALRKISIVDKEHDFFACLEGEKTILSEAPLKVELDGVVLERYREKKGIKLSEMSVEEVSGALLTAWSFYGGELRKVVLARDYRNKHGGRIISFGSIGWPAAALQNEDVASITMNAISHLVNGRGSCGQQL